MIAHCAKRYNLSTSTHNICICASPQRGFVWVRLQLLNVEHSCWMGFCTKPSQRCMALLVPHTVVPGSIKTGGSGQSTTWEIHLGLQDLSSLGCIKLGSHRPWSTLGAGKKGRVVHREFNDNNETHQKFDLLFIIPT